MKEKDKAGLGIIIIILLFLLSVYIGQTNFLNINEFLDKGVIGKLVYIFITIIATVIAPISALPLLPIVSNAWGWLTAAILSIIGWTIGSLIAFILARIYGVPLIKKFISLKNIEKWEKRIPEENIFWTIVFLRISVPVDILSYVLGLFSKIKTGKYILATIIGVAPFAFILSYVGTFPIKYQLLALAVALIILLIGLSIRKRVVKRQKIKD